MTSSPLPSLGTGSRDSVAGLRAFSPLGQCPRSDLVGSEEGSGELQVLRYVPRLLAESLTKGEVTVTIGFDISAGTTSIHLVTRR